VVGRELFVVPCTAGDFRHPRLRLMQRDNRAILCALEWAQREQNRRSEALCRAERQLLREGKKRRDWALTRRHWAISNEKGVERAEVASQGYYQCGERGSCRGSPGALISLIWPLVRGRIGPGGGGGGEASGSSGAVDSSILYTPVNPGPRATSDDSSLAPP
jgi:hypothetical protein